MKSITSRDNPTFKAIRQLARDAGTSRDDGLVLIEGVHLCDAFVRQGGRPREIVVGQSALVRPDVSALLERVDLADGFVFDDGLFGSISQLMTAVPLLMVIDRPRPDRPVRIERNAVLLDRVQDPGNVGSILRSAAAAGIVDVFLSDACAGAWSPKVVRAAMGAHFRLQLYENCALDALTEGSQVGLLATSPHGARTVFDVDLARPVAWLLGHEGHGVAQHLLDRATVVRIPQADAVESLNVAAAAAICFFEQRRQTYGVE